MWLSLTPRELGTVVHAGAGALVLLRCVNDGHSSCTAVRCRRLGGGACALAIFVWLTVLSGTGIRYPWDRATPPDTIPNVVAGPHLYLLEHLRVTNWQLFGREWQAHGDGSTTATAQPLLLPAQATAGCDMTLAPTATIDGRTSRFRALQPGAVVCLHAGWWDKLSIQNVAGTPGQRITFRNVGGPVRAERLVVHNVQHVAILGNGTPGVEYGFAIASRDVGASFRRKTEHLEAGYISIVGGSIGLNAKTQATCADGTGNPIDSYDYTNDGRINSQDAIPSSYVVHDLHFHHFRIQDVGAEAMYLGSNDTTTAARELRCTPTPANPVIRGLRVHDNIVADFGKDGINVKGTPSDCAVYNNRVLGGSTARQPQQVGAIAVMDNTACDVTGNYIDGNLGPGIADVGNGGNTIADNTILHVGRMFAANHDKGAGISIITHATKGTYVLGNTITDPRSFGIYMSDNRSAGSVIRNNAISGATTDIVAGPGASIN